MSERVFNNNISSSFKNLNLFLFIPIEMDFNP